MVQDFTTTEAYRHIKEAGVNGKPFALAYFTDTRMLVTEENVERLIETDYLRYKHKLDEAIKLAPALLTMQAVLYDRVAQGVRQFMGKNYLRLHTDYATANEIDYVVKEIEANPDFAGWCMN